MNDQETYDLERAAYWNCEIPEYYNMPPCQKKNAKRKYNQTRYNKESAMYSTAANLNIHAPAPNTEADTIKRERSYLETRAYSIWTDKRLQTRRDFGLADDRAPQSPQEMVDRIKAGMFVLPENWDENDETDPTWFISRITWRDPAKVKDKEGCKTALMALEKEHNKLVDSIQIKDPECALAELHAWETT